MHAAQYQSGKSENASIHDSSLEFIGSCHPPPLAFRVHARKDVSFGGIHNHAFVIVNVVR